MAKWSIGCSGFHYKHWKLRFYPDKLPQRKWFEFYCEHFQTLELNVTFYRFPKLSFLQSWYERSSAKFQFAVKAPKAITHYKKFNDTDRLISDFYSTIEEGLKDKLGCVLFQMPPMFTYTEERLEKIINSLDTSFNNVLEFRHNTWWKQFIYDELSKHKISFCGMSHPTLPDDIIQNTSVLYYRMHGVPNLYQSPYSVPSLKKLVNYLEKAGKTKNAFIYFNNDIDASAIQNAKEMKKLTERKK